MTARAAENVRAAEVFRAVRTHLSPSLAVAGKLAGSGAVEVAAQGCRVSLSDGRAVLDFGSYAVTLLGHRYPTVVAAVEAQLHTMPTATRTLANPVVAAAAARLVAHLGGVLPRVYFGLNGADAVETATKLARWRTGRPRLLAVEGGYHGKSLGALALTHHERFRDGLGDVLGPTTHLRPDDPDAVAREVRRGDVAALVAEPVQGENGVVPLDPALLRRWCADAREAGSMVIADEIQCGLGRYGAASVALDAGLPVDALLLGKPLGGGVVPVSAVLATDDLFQPLTRDPSRHTATFGGHPLCLAAVPAALDAITALLPGRSALSERLGAGLARLSQTFPTLVGAVRGGGLMWGVDFTSPAVAGEVLTGVLRRGLLVSPCLSRPTTLRLLPPLVAGPDEIDEALAILEASLGEDA